VQCPKNRKDYVTPVSCHIHNRVMRLIGQVPGGDIGANRQFCSGKHTVHDPGIHSAVPNRLLSLTLAFPMCCSVFCTRGFLPDRTSFVIDALGTRICGETLCGDHVPPTALSNSEMTFPCTIFGFFVFSSLLSSAFVITNHTQGRRKRKGRVQELEREK
jgi:hypothetical protein